MSETGTVEPRENVTLAVVTNAPAKTGVGLGRRFEISDRGIKFRGVMPIDQYRDLLGGLKSVKDHYAMCLATAVRYGKEHLGIEAVEQILLELGFDHQDAVRALGVGQLTFDFAETDLSAEHLWVLARSFPDNPEKQAEWRAKVQKHGLSALALSRSIDAGRVILDEDLSQQSGRNSGGLGFLHQLRAQCEVWERRLGGRQNLLSLEPEMRREWLENDGQYMEKLVAEVRESLEVAA